MFKRITHIGIAFRDLAISGPLFTRLLGKKEDHEEEVADQQVRTRLFRIGDGGIELLEPTSPGSPVARFIEKRGEGIHHLSFEVTDIEAEIVRLKGEGFLMIDEEPRMGADGCRIAFLHPKSTNGILIELSERIR